MAVVDPAVSWPTEKETLAGTIQLRRLNDARQTGQHFGKSAVMKISIIYNAFEVNH